MSAAEISDIGRCDDLAAAALRHLQMLDIQLAQIPGSAFRELDASEDAAALFTPELVEQGEALSEQVSRIGCAADDMETMVRDLAAESPFEGLTVRIISGGEPIGQESFEGDADG